MVGYYYEHALFFSLHNCSRPILRDRLALMVRHLFCRHFYLANRPNRCGDSELREGLYCIAALSRWAVHPFFEFTSKCRKE